MGEPTGTDPGLDDLDAALNNLEVKLEGSASTDMLVRRGSGQGLVLGSGSSVGIWSPSDSSSLQDNLTTIPELKDHLRIFR